MLDSLDPANQLAAIEVLLALLKLKLPRVGKIKLSVREAFYLDESKEPNLVTLHFNPRSLAALVLPSLQVLLDGLVKEGRVTKAYFYEMVGSVVKASNVLVDAGEGQYKLVAYEDWLAGVNQTENV